MNGSTIAPEYEQLATRVNRVVERENRGRRRARWLFLLLLIVPVTVLVVIFQKGKTDSEWVQQNARVAVEPELKAVRKAADGIKEVLPEVQGAVAMVEESNQRIEAVEHLQADYLDSHQASLTRLEDQQRTTKHQVERLSQMSSETTHIATDVPRMTRDPRVDELLERVAALEGALESFQMELMRMRERGAVRQPENLEDRLRVIERRLQIEERRPVR